MQTAGDCVTSRTELAARMQNSHYHLDRRAFFGGMHIYRDSAAVITNPHPAIGLKGDLNMVTIAGQGFINRVIDYLVHQVVQTALPG